MRDLSNLEEQVFNKCLILMTEEVKESESKLDETLPDTLSKVREQYYMEASSDADAR